MKPLGRFMAWLFTPVVRLNAFEQAVIEASRSGDHPVAQRIDELLGYVWRYRRSEAGRFLIFDSKPVPEVLRFTNQSVNFPVCKVTLQAGGVRCKCDVLIAHGYLQILEWEGRAPDHTTAEINVLRVSFSKQAFIGPKAPQERGTVTMLPMLGEVRQLVPGADREEIADWESEIEVTLPPSMRKLLRETNGFQTDSITFYGTDVKRLDWPDESYAVLAEDQAQRFGIAVRTSDTDLHIIDQLDEDVLFSTKDAAHAFEWLLKTILNPPWE
jgi:hypothetical protein